MLRRRVSRCRAPMSRRLHSTAAVATSQEQLAAALASGDSTQPDANIYRRLSHRVLPLSTGGGAAPKKVALFQLGTAPESDEEGTPSPGPTSDEQELWSV